MDGCIDAWMYGCMDVWCIGMHVQECMYRWYVCMYKVGRYVNI